jgi:hypothetical protein
MKPKKLTILAGWIMTALTFGLAGCGTTATQKAPADMSAGEPALKVTGAVAYEQTWTEDEVKGMDTIDVVSTNSKGEESTYSGVLLSELLSLSQPEEGAATVVFVADDGTTAEISLEELTACADCIASFRNQGGFSTVLPGYPGSMQVKGVIEIQVK